MHIDLTSIWIYLRNMNTTDKVEKTFSLLRKYAFIVTNDVYSHQIISVYFIFIFIFRINLKLIWVLCSFISHTRDPYSFYCKSELIILQFDWISLRQQCNIHGASQHGSVR